MQTNRIMAFLTAIVFATLILGANIGQFMTLDYTLRAQAGDDALNWAVNLVDSVPDIGRLATTGTASTEQLVVLGEKLSDQSAASVAFFSWKSSRAKA